MLRVAAACGLAILGGAAALAATQARPVRQAQAPEATARVSPGRIETLRAVAALPVEIVGEFREPLGYERLASGDELVFDRRGHAVYRVPRDRSGAQKLVAIGGEDGKVIEPTAFDATPDGIFVVADAPNGRERVQIFTPDGRRAGGFQLPGRATARVTLGSLSLSGVGTLQFTGRSVLISQPETGGLMTEYGLAGTPVRTIGRLRATGHEADRELHLALNAGIPLKGADGGYWFVFLAGKPALSRFDATGKLLFHRRIQGRELDPVMAAIPAVWPRRAFDGSEVPLVSPTVRTAALDPAGQLLGVVRRALHLCLRRPRREGADGAIPGRRARRPQQPQLPVWRPPARDAGLFRVRRPLGPPPADRPPLAGVAAGRYDLDLP
ncbi:MAG: hypothetical protein KA371_05370 [Acidobacteria bacterium]|nr:hypothetical protein [Acidobacteriota bacterium]